MRATSSAPATRRASPPTATRRWRRRPSIAPDLVVLDLMLPGHRRPGGHAPPARPRPRPPAIILLTARGEESDRIIGLRLGADDYVVKPFSPAELVARVDAVLRRVGHEPEPEPPLEFGERRASTRPRAGCTVGGEEVRADPARVRAAAVPRPPSRPGVHARGAHGPGLALLVLHGHVDGHRPRPPAAREDRARPGACRATSRPCGASATGSRHDPQPRRRRGSPAALAASALGGGRSASTRRGVRCVLILAPLGLLDRRGGARARRGAPRASAAAPPVRARWRVVAAGSGDRRRRLRRASCSSRATTRSSRVLVAATARALAAVGRRGLLGAARSPTSTRSRATLAAVGHGRRDVRTGVGGRDELARLARRRRRDGRPARTPRSARAARSSPPSRTTCARRSPRCGCSSRRSTTTSSTSATAAEYVPRMRHPRARARRAHRRPLRAHPAGDRRPALDDGAGRARRARRGDGRGDAPAGRRAAWSPCAPSSRASSPLAHADPGAAPARALQPHPERDPPHARPTAASTVRADRADGAVEIEVADTGSGHRRRRARPRLRAVLPGRRSQRPQPTAAPASGSRSRARSSRRTAGGSGSPTPSAGPACASGCRARQPREARAD